MVANIVEKMMVAFWLCTELSTTFVDMGGFFITQVEGPIPASPRGFGCAGLGVGSWYSHPYSYGYPTYYGPTYYGHPLLRMNTDACLQSLFVPGALDGKEIMRSNNGRCLERNRKLLTHRWRGVDSNF